MVSMNAVREDFWYSVGGLAIGFHHGRSRLEKPYYHYRSVEVGEDSDTEFITDTSLMRMRFSGLDQSGKNKEIEKRD